MLFRLFLPVVCGYDGYITSHTAQPVKLENQEKIDNFIPPLNHHINLSDISQVKGIDPVTTPHIVKRAEGTAPGYYEYRYALQRSLENSINIIKEVHDEFAKKFGRSYGNGILKTIETDDADIIIFAMGSVASQSRVAIKKLRSEGLKIGLIILKLFRPFPAEELRQFFKDKENIIVFDRDIGYGYEGVLSYELKAALYGLKNRPNIKGFIVGLGGRDVKTEHIITGVHTALNEFKQGIFTNKTEFLGLRLDELSDYDESTYFKSGEK